MSKQFIHSTRREVFEILRRPGVTAIFIVATLLLVLAGPFGTQSAMSFTARLGYWMTIVVITGSTGTIITVTMRALLNKRPRWFVTTMIICVASSVITLFVLGINWFLLGLAPFRPDILLGIGLNTLAIAAIVTGVAIWRDSTHAAENLSDPELPPPAQDMRPALLDRLPFDKRGALISMTVRDHYVEIVTTSGTELLLMRLSDAIRETTGCKGMQIHRSHWIALDQIIAVNRDGPRANVRLSDGRDIPASRTYVPALKEAGLLPTLRSD